MNAPGQGFEAVFPHNVLRADVGSTAPLVPALKSGFSYETSFAVFARNLRK